MACGICISTYYTSCFLGGLNDLGFDVFQKVNYIYFRSYISITTLFVLFSILQ